MSAEFPDMLTNLAYFVRLDEAIQQLADLAEKEDWSYSRAAVQRANPVLFNYIVFTYRRLVEQERIEVADNGQYLTFNTGLVTENQEEIFALFDVNRNLGREPWHFVGWRKKSDSDLGRFSRLPEMATYFDDPACLVLDTRKELRINIDHVIEENKERFPVPYNSMTSYQLSTIVKGATDNALGRVKRNYKTAIPQYYGGKVQLLMPLCLSDPSRADLALVIDDKGSFYRAATCLTLDMAYNNARQLARPDRDWLQP